MAVYDHFPLHLDAVEACILGCLLLVMSKHGIELRVRDEEAEVFRTKTPTLAAIHIGHTDTTHLDLFDRPERRLGTISLVHGNGAEVIADWSWPPDHPTAEAKLDAFVAHALHHGEEGAGMRRPTRPTEPVNPRVDADGWADDHLTLMDELAKKRMASYAAQPYVDPYADLKARNAEAQRAVDNYVARTGREVGPTERKILLQRAIMGRLPKVR